MAKHLFATGLFLSCSFLLFAQKTIIRGNFSQTIILNGFLKAQRAENLVVPQSTSWQIQLKWMAKEGTNVKPGDAVVRFDTSNLVTEIENLETSLELKWD